MVWIGGDSGGRGGGSLSVATFNKIVNFSHLLKFELLHEDQLLRTCYSLQSHSRPERINFMLYAQPQYPFTAPRSPPTWQSFRNKFVSHLYVSVCVCQGCGCRTKEQRGMMHVLCGDIRWQDRNYCKFIFHLAGARSKIASSLGSFSIRQDRGQRQDVRNRFRRGRCGNSEGGALAYARAG